MVVECSQNEAVKFTYQCVFVPEEKNEKEGHKLGHRSSNNRSHTARKLTPGSYVQLDLPHTQRYRIQAYFSRSTSNIRQIMSQPTPHVKRQNSYAVYMQKPMK